MDLRLVIVVENGSALSTTREVPLRLATVLESDILGSRTRMKDQGSRMKAGGRTRRPARQDPEDQGSRIKDQGPCPAMNEHPRRDTDVILRQSKAPIEIFNSR